MNDIINNFAHKHRCSRFNQQQMIEALILELSGLNATLNKRKEKEENGLNAGWKDAPEELKEWYINENNEPQQVSFGDPIDDIENLRELGLLFETREEAEKAVEKLKAFKRLKDKGFRFTGYSHYDWNGDKSPAIAFEYSDFDKMFDDKQVAADLDLLFSGGEE